MIPLQNLLCHFEKCARTDSAIPVADVKGEIHTSTSFLNQINQLRLILEEHENKKWFLNTESSYLFAIQFFSLLLAHKDIALPQNSQCETLRTLENQGYLSCPRAEIRLNDKTEMSSYEPLALTGENKILLFTSGSSGVPKACEKSLREFNNEIHCLEETFGATLGESLILSSVSHQHIYGLLFKVLWPLCSGRPFLDRPIAHPEMLRQELRNERPCAFVSSPTFLELTGEYPHCMFRESPQLTIFSSGGPLPEAVASKVRTQLGAEPIEVYGSTETGGVAWRRHSTSADGAWTPFREVSITRSEKATLLVNSSFLHPSLLQGEKDGYITEDSVHLLESGRFLLRGRTDRIVKVGEKRLSLLALEHALNQHPFVRKSCAVTLGRSSGTRSISVNRKVVACAVVLDTQGESIPRNFGRGDLIAILQTHLLQSFDAVCIPKYWRFPEKLPTNSQGKHTQHLVTRLFEHPENLPKPGKILDPLVISTSKKPSDASFSLAIPRKLSFLDGHFPENPIVPGFVLFEWAKKLALSTFSFNESHTLSRVSNLKFLRPIRGGDMAELQVKMVSPPKITSDTASSVSFRFTYRSLDSIVSSGTFTVTT